ncbi:Alkaline phosphatase synthesis transcriptional regulatory protein PhoP [Pelotomaculum sp. FP]|uniref:response regulator transcription factor n=1 Tax=Pelotomaculum sp. FP TaxID=261474 RepID=UPI001065E78D|nr:response regulator transcription factor [Pelotomaculum sp. FP]TEB16333.1 Alkaline phosphatase synthesis transcriptional regulatory protein PhoP [Pelotomaculum sp. FP]
MPRILAVDDDPKILKILQHTLSKEGFEVILAASGEEALQKARRQPPELVVLDIMMPGMDGFETFQNLKAQYHDMPVIILSARSDEVDKVVGFRMGVDDYQTKPFSPTELALRIKAVLRRLGEPAKQQRQVLKYDGLILDYSKRIVTQNNLKIELTPKEFEVLWLMASNPNKVFTKANLLDQVWDSAFYGDDNTVTVHIRRLREKLEKDPSNPCYIKTVWGIGYKFESEE